MRKKISWVIYLLLILILRLFLAYQIDGFSSDESYFSLRQIESIKDSGKLFYFDELSYGGREQALPPFPYYFFSFFNMFLDLKVIINILALVSIGFVYLLAFELTKNRSIAFITGGISAFIPIVFSETINLVSPVALAIPLFLSCIYFFLKIEKDKKALTGYVISLILFLFSHPFVILFVFGLLIYLIITKLEKMKVSNAETEVIIFSIFITLWSQFLIYKKVLMSYGFLTVFQNIPKFILNDFFQQISISEATTKIGLFPLIFGMYVIYKYSFIEKKRIFTIFVSTIIPIAVLIWLKLIQLNIGLIFISLILTILFSQFLKDFLIFIEKSKFSYAKPIFTGIIIFLFAVTSIFPSISFAMKNIDNSFSSEESSCFSYLDEKNSTIIASYVEGNFVSFYSGMKNVIDSKYLFIENIDDRFENIKEIYSTRLETGALEIFTNMKGDYFYVSDRALNSFNKEGIAYLNNEKCFELICSNSKSKIYKIKCRLE